MQYSLVFPFFGGGEVPSSVRLHSCFSPDVYNLYQILVTIPQTERMFSSVKRIKTRLRSQMTTVRLSNLALLSIEKDIADTLCYNDVIEHFKLMKIRRFLL